MASFNLSKTNDEAAALTAVGAFVTLLVTSDLPLIKELGLAVLAGLGVLGYTGYNSKPAA